MVMPPNESHLTGSPDNGDTVHCYRLNYSSKVCHWHAAYKKKKKKKYFLAVSSSCLSTADSTLAFRIEMYS